MARRLLLATALAGAALAIQAPALAQATINTITDMQRALNTLGYNAGTPDGLMGARTRQAIRDFQADNNLQVTGQPSASLNIALQSLLGGATSVGAGASVNTGVNTGVVPPQQQAPSYPTQTVPTQTVSQVQAALRQRGYDVPAVTGQLDTATQTAIRTYQSDVGLPATGQITQTLLTALGAGAQQPTQQQQTAASQRQLIASIQAALNARGYDAGPADGVLGPKSQVAIRTYQSDAGLAPTGQASASLLQSLQAGGTVASTGSAQATVPASTSATAASTAQAQMVYEIEDELQQKGYNPGPVDGVFNAQTSAAVRQFQQAAGLSVTGSADAQLLATLRASSVTAASAATPTDPAQQLLQGVTNEIFSRIQR